MHNELLHIGPLTVYGYGFMIAMGPMSGRGQWLCIRFRLMKSCLIFMTG